MKSYESQFEISYEDQFDDVFNIIDHESSKNQKRLQKLFEMYRRPDLSWVPEFIDDLYKYPKSIQKLAIKHDIIFKRAPNQTSMFQGKYNHLNNKFIISINNQTINNIKNGKNLDFISEQLIEVLTHEHTHFQQNQLKWKDQPYYSRNYDNQYLSQYSEIDAFARQVARNIEYEYGDNPDISDIRNLDKLTSLSRRIIHDYYDIGGAVLKKFLKEIYNWFHEPEDKQSTKYKEWLFQHRS